MAQVLGDFPKLKGFNYGAPCVGDAVGRVAWLLTLKVGRV